MSKSEDSINHFTHHFNTLTGPSIGVCFHTRSYVASSAASVNPVGAAALRQLVGAVGQGVAEAAVLDSRGKEHGFEACRCSSGEQCGVLWG